MVGTFAVGKTSLVSRYVHSIFSDRYLTTVGVKLEEKLLEHAGRELKLVIWDLHGEDEFQKLRPSYLRGTAGALFVADGTRPETIAQALELRELVETAAGSIPCLLLLNKKDLTSAWRVTPAEVAALEGQGWTVLLTSAKSGEGVDEAFTGLATRLLEGTGDAARPDRPTPE